MPFRLFGKCSAPLLAALGVFGCHREEPDFRPARDFAGKSSSIPWGLGAAERFDLRPPSAPSGKSEEKEDKEPPLHLAYEVPQGWSEMPATPSRVANFRVAGDENAECYLTLLAGDGGGMVANLNRWRMQISLDPLEKSEIDALPQSLFFGGQATLLEATGTWKGMEGTRSDADWGLKGLVLVSQGASAFLKMTGPARTLENERNRFLQLAASFRFEPAKEKKIETAPATAPTPTDALPMADAQGLRWNAPGSWQMGPARPMRIASWIPREGVDVSLAALEGQGGGALANANRWRKQMGQTDLSADEFEALPRIEVLGGSHRWIEIEGSGESAGRTLIGVIASTATKTVFFKMTGPTESVKAERENFRVLVQSLQEAS